MKIRFDHGTPAPQRNHLREHSVDRSAEKGWELLETGELIRKAEEEGYKAGRRKGQSTSPVPWGGFPLVGATLVVALPVQATEIDRGPPRDSDAMSRRSTGSGLVRAEEGTHTRGAPTEFECAAGPIPRIPAETRCSSVTYSRYALSECLVRRAQPRFRCRVGLSPWTVDVPNLVEGQTADDPEATGERYEYRVLQKTIEADPALGPVSQKDAGPSSSVTTRLPDRARQIIF